MSAPRLQVVVAHPDDETFGCGSLLLHAAAGGAETAVCCATRGEAGEVAPGRTPGAAGLGGLREEELRAAASVLGVARVDLLGFTDSGMSGVPGPDTLVGVPFEQVVAAVAQRLTAFRPDVVVTLDASDGHRDHVRIRDAALTAAHRCGIPRIYLQCLPRSLVRRWVGHMQQHRPEIEHLGGELQALGTPDEDITTVVDTAGHLAARERAMARHASQVSPFDGLPEDLRLAFLTTDHLRRLTPPWTGGPKETDIL